MSVSTQCYDFEIPPERVAAHPRPKASQLLLTYTKATGEINHSTFSRLGAFLHPGDVMVFNDSKVLPAKVHLCGEKWSGQFLILLRPYAFPDEQCLLLKEVQVISSAQRFEPGSILPLMGGAQFAVQGVIQSAEEYTHYRGVLHFPEAKPTTLEAYLNTWGELPLPPYLNRPTLPQDRQDYQTSYASHPGSIAAPTAGLHFSPALLHHLALAEIELLRVTLHIGYGTFRAFSTATVEEHHMDPEHYSVSKETALSLWRALREGRRVIAVGTTSARTLETVADTLCSDVAPSGDLVGESRLFIYPPFTFRVLSGLITNFHYPRTSVLALTAAMCGGRDILIDTIYQEALRRDYLWFSYGDAMLIY